MTAAEHATLRASAGSWVLAATIVGSSMAFIDNTVVNVALPVLQEQLGATVAQVQWVVESYALLLAALLLVGGALGDRYGRRLVYAIGVAIFALASVWCGMAANVQQLIWARAAQGVGGALLVPGSLAIIGAYFSGEQRGQAIGSWSAWTAITTALGPVLGGWLVEYASWRLVFFINVPLALFVLAALYRYVPESRDEEAPRALDWPGALLITLGLGALVYGLIEAGVRGFGDPLVLAGLLGGTLLLAAFVLVEARSATPMLPPQVFAVRAFRGANLLTLLLYAALGGMFFFLPFNLIQVQGYSPTAAGGALLPFILIVFALSRWAGGLTRQRGERLPLIVGASLAALGFGLLALPGIGGSYWTTFFPPIVVLGLGMAICIAPLTTTVMGALEARHAGLASGINNAVSRVAGLLAIAALGIVAVWSFGGSLAARLAALDIPDELRAAILEQRVKLAALDLPAEAEASLRPALAEAVAWAFVDSFRLLMLIAMGLALASALIAALMIPGRARREP
jgi:EmrB/QacA subfamily drug resistance transporter